MANNRQIPSLTDVAFEALLRHRGEITTNSEAQYEVLMQYKLKKEIPLFLQYIADGDPDSAKELLEDNPQLAVIAYGSVTTSSGNTYENVTAIQLAYLMDDVDMCTMMMPFINQLPKEMIKKANDELAKKMAEVEVQKSQFKPFDFNPLVQAITADQALIDTGKNPNAETEKELAKLKEYFKTGTIKFGKSFIKEHLQEGFRITENIHSMNGKQLQWYFINCMGHIQTLAEKCFEQESSQGLQKIVDEKKPLRRSTVIKHNLSMAPLIHNGSYVTYRGSHDSSLLLGRHFYVEIYSGCIGCRPWDVGSIHKTLETFAKQKDQAWKNLSSSLSSNNHPVNNQKPFSSF